MTFINNSNIYYVGWDVGGWNCDKNSKSRDSVVILDSMLSIVGKPWRGNLRSYINEAKSTKNFSQATKGIHVLAKFAPNVKSCGVWSDGSLLTAIEAYPSACKDSVWVDSLRQQMSEKPNDNEDKTDALTCALIAYIFTNYPEKLIGPDSSIPLGEGWIWVPKDVIME